MRRITALVLVPTLVLVLTAFKPRLRVGPLGSIASSVSRLGVDQPQKLTVRIVDLRGPDAILGGGYFGKKAEGSLFLGWLPPAREDVARVFEAAASEAAMVLGFEPGGDITLELAIDDFYIDTYQVNAYAPQNCIGYGHLTTTVTAPGRDPSSRTFAVAYWEDTVDIFGKGLDFLRESYSRIYSQAAWEAVARTLLEELGARPDPDLVAATLAALPTLKESVERRAVIHWLGLVGAGDAQVERALLDLVRTSKDQRSRQASIESLGRMRSPAGKALAEAVLARTTTLPEWTLNDTEEVWNLLRALCLAGERELAGRVPKGDFTRGEKLDGLASFCRTGQSPAPTAGEAAQITLALERFKDD